MVVDTEELARNVTRLLPPYRVLLHNEKCLTGST
jgi:hypothetical protein